MSDFIEYIKKNMMLKEDSYENAINGYEQNITNADAQTVDQMPQVQQYPQQPAQPQGYYQDQQVDPNGMMGFDPNVQDISIGDRLQASETYSNVLIFNLSISLYNIAKKLKEDLNNAINPDMITKSQLYASHEGFYALDELISQLEYYIDMKFETSEYRDNLESYLAYRNAYIKIIKKLKDALDI